MDHPTAKNRRASSLEICQIVELEWKVAPRPFDLRYPIPPPSYGGAKNVDFRFYAKFDVLLLVTECRYQHCNCVAGKAYLSATYDVSVTHTKSATVRPLGGREMMLRRKSRFSCDFRNYYLDNGDG